MAIPRVFNSTIYTTTGLIKSAICENAPFSLKPGTALDDNWMKEKDDCTVLEISADVHMDGKTIKATPYSTIGSNSVDYLIVQTGVESFIVTRKVT